VRKLFFIGIGLWLCGCLVGIARAETFELTDGRTLTAELIPASADDSGVQVRLEDNKYERVPWGSFSQEDLKRFVQDDRNKKMAQFARPFIETSPGERLRQAEIRLNHVPRLERPASKSLLGAMFASGVGILTLLLLYAANIYAAYEVAIFRGRPIGLVCGVSAVAPLVGPILFLAMPMHMKSEEAPDAAPHAAAVIQPFAVPNSPGSAATGGTGGQAEDAAHAAGLRLAPADPGSAAAGLPQTQVFQRGAFTFNRRFFETKFSGFFGVIRRDAEKEMVMVIKAARGQFVANRITRITANDMHVQIQKGSASEEVMVPFSEIQEVQLKHQDA
jgi:hypothetical protein